MRTVFLTLAAWVGMTAAAFAQPPNQPAVLIHGKLNEVEKLGQARSLSEPNLATLTGCPCEFRYGGEIAVATTEGEQVGIEFVPIGFTLRLTASELRDCKFRLHGEIEYVWLTDKGKTVAERRRVVRAPLPATVLPGRRTRLELQTETGKTLVFEFDLEELR